jgi:hypothetical protein
MKSKRLAAYMAQDRPLLATMASNMSTVQAIGSRAAINRAREILGLLDGEIK